MKLVTFVKAGEERLGLFAGETVIDCSPGAALRCSGAR
jgi:hypothetical protein